MFHVSQCLGHISVSRESFADTKLREDDAEQIFDVYRPCDPPQSIARQTQLLRAQLKLLLHLGGEREMMPA